MRQFFKSRGYLDSIVNTVRHRSEQIDRQQVLQKSQEEKSKSPSPFIHITMQSKSSFLKNFKLLQNDPESSDNFFHNLH